jgi:ABC-type amino acid transport system permease subunit
MAVAHDGSAQLAHALGLILQTLHRDGELIDLARANKIDAGFLEAQQEVWTRPACQNPNFAGAIGCILPPLNIDVQRTRFASSVETVEVWLATRLGVHMSLPMFTSAAAWTLLCNGVVNSLLLVVGTLVATLACALMLAIVLDMPWRLPRLAAWLLGITLRSSPIVLTLVIAQALASALVPYSAAVALIASILTLGLVNGAYAAQAIAEAAHTLRADPRMTGISSLALFRRAVQRSAKQIESFLVNATKGTPAASFIGAPELLNALTDISSFSSERMTTYSLLLVFYTVVVMGVVRVGRWLRRATDLGRLPA